MFVRKAFFVLTLTPLCSLGSGQTVCNQVGNQIVCNGAGGPQQYNFPEQMAAMQQAQAAQQQAQAAQMAARAQMLQAQTQARIAGQQAEREAAEHERAEAAMKQQEGREHDNAVRNTPADAEELRVKTRAAVAADTTPGLKAKAATIEAVMRSSPPDSDTFRSATGALAVINEELAKRGELK